MTSTNHIIDGKSNTRLIQENDITSHCDYGRWSHESLSPEDFHQLLVFVAADHVVEMDRQWSAGGNATYYPNKIIGINGFVGGFGVKDDGSISCMIQCSGQYWEQMNNIDMWHLFQGLKHRFNMKSSRVDYAVDDPSYWVIPVAEIKQAVDDKLNFGFRNVAISASGTNFKDMQETVYLGSRESSKFTRIYDHDGECLRHETEFKRELAQEYFNLIADLEREDYRYVTDGFDGYRDDDGTLLESFDDVIARRICGAVTGAIDFRTRDAYKDSSRVSSRDSKRLGFYQQYIDRIRASVVRIKAIKPPKTLHKTYEWVKRSVSQTLAMFREGLGRHEFNLFIDKVVSEGQLKMTNEKEMWVKEIRRKPIMFQS